MDDKVAQIAHLIEMASGNPAWQSSERRLENISLCWPKGSSFDMQEYFNVILGLFRASANCGMKVDNLAA